MIESVGSIILLIIIIGCIVYWFVLKKQIDEEDGDRIEPHIDSSFSEFSQQDLPQDHDQKDRDDEENHEEVVMAKETAQPEEMSMMAEPETKNNNYDLFEEDAPETMAEETPKKGFLARLKETFGGDKNASTENKDGQSLTRPAPIRTIALILKAPEDQPYLGQEVLEVGGDLQLMIGGNGYLQHIVTTFLGDESVYSIAHMLSPGSFNEPDILTKELPGLLFFAQIPGPDVQMNTVQYMLKAAAYYGQELGGDLLDENQRPVDQDYVAKLLEEASEIEQQAWAKHRALR